jgi:TetR/AcrR family acrAB operon transcriptional repressor
MARKTKEEALQTREDILSAAIEVFVTKGVASASLEQIAETAGVTRGAVYWHFKNKRDIFEALHEQLHIPMMNIVEKQLGQDHPAPLEQLRTLCTEWLLDLERDPVTNRILTIFLVKCDYSGEMAEVLEQLDEHRTETHKIFMRYFEKAQKLGQLLPQADIHVLTLSLHCFVCGVASEYLRFPGRFDLQNQAKNMIDTFFNVLTTRA